MNAKALRHPLLILGLALAVATVLVLLKPAPEVIVPEPKPLLVDVLEVQPGTLAISVKAQGIVQPSTQTSLVSEVSGRIVEVADSFNAGGFFRAGEVLLRVDDRDYQTRLQQSQALVAQARSMLAQERGRAEVAKREWEQRSGRNKVSNEARQLALRKPQMLEAEAQLESALAGLRQARLDLERTVIMAPYDGLVAAKSAEIGQYITAGSPVGKIMAVEDAEVRLAIPESKLDYLTLPDAYREGGGEHAEVDLSYNIDGRETVWSGRLVRTEGVLDQRSRSLFVVAQLPDPYGLYSERSEDFVPLRFGMFVDARVEGRQVENVIALPRGIIRPGNLVWIVDDNNRLQQRKLQLLRTDGAEIFVTEGLDAGDRVTLTGVGPVLPGTKVDIASVVRQSDTDREEAQRPATGEVARKPPTAPAGAALSRAPGTPEA